MSRTVQRVSCALQNFELYGSGLSVKRWLLLLTCAFLLSATNAFGQSIGETGYYQHSLGELALQTLLYIPLWVLIILLCVVLVDMVSTSATRPLFDRLTPSFRARSIAIFAAVMVAAWAVYLIGFFPGTMNWDTYYQIHQCYPASHPILQIPWLATESYIPNYFCDHHPIFDTLLFGFFAVGSDALFDTWNYGNFLYSILQSALTAASFCFGCAYLKERGVPSIACFIVFLFYCLLPVFPIDALTMLKDTLFSWIFVFYFIVVIEIVRTKAAVLQERKWIVAFILLSVFLALTKKTGIYLVFASSILFLFIYRTQWKRFLLSALVPAVVMWIALPYVVFPLLDVAPGGKQEALAPVFQQTARYVSLYGDEMSEEEYEAIDAVLDMDTLSQRYNPLNADPVKFGYNYLGDASELKEYFLVYAAQGLKHPEVYIEASAATALSYLSLPAKIVPHTNAGSEVEGESPQVWHPKVFDGLRNGLETLYETLSSLPVVGGLFTIVLYAWWIPVISFFIVAGRRKDLLPVYIVVALSLVCCFITPLVHARYAYPLIYIAPLLCLLMFFPSREKEKKAVADSLS